ncbi:MAG: hypothetical protein QOF76_5214 [Solirubrobacteraceae bacterium]|nr:hypothetical protein [Solirubrobacteraceae bacterium]
MKSGAFWPVIELGKSQEPVPIAVHAGACRSIGSGANYGCPGPRIGMDNLFRLVAIGFTRSAIEAALRSGRLHRVHRGVYAVGTPVLDAYGRALAAVLAFDDAVLSHQSAGALYLLHRYEGPVHVSLPYEHPDRDGVLVHESRATTTGSGRASPSPPPPGPSSTWPTSSPRTPSTPRSPRPTSSASSTAPSPTAPAVARSAPATNSPVPRSNAPTCAWFAPPLISPTP